MAENVAQSSDVKARVLAETDLGQRVWEMQRGFPPGGGRGLQLIIPSRAGPG